MIFNEAHGGLIHDDLDRRELNYPVGPLIFFFFSYYWSSNLSKWKQLLFKIISLIVTLIQQNDFHLLSYQNQTKEMESDDDCKLQIEKHSDKTKY